MAPDAFHDLTLRLRQTEAFDKRVLSTDEVREIAAAAFCRLARSGNAAQCWEPHSMDPEDGRWTAGIEP